MTRKQARRRKQKKATRFSLPKIRMAHVAAPLVETAVRDVAAAALERWRNALAPSPATQPAE